MFSGMTLPTAPPSPQSVRDNTGRDNGGAEQGEGTGSTLPGDIAINVAGSTFPAAVLMPALQLNLPRVSRTIFFHS
jgi:hypothetical protein